MSKTELDLSPELRAWVEERNMETQLADDITEIATRRERDQKENRREALYRFSKKEECGQNINFESIETYLETPVEVRTPEDTKDYKFRLEFLSNEYGERYVALMHREWRISRLATQRKRDLQ